jgi:hypothetical protein
MAWRNEEKRAQKKLKKELGHIAHTPYTTLDVLEGVFLVTLNGVGLIIEFLWFIAVLAIMAFFLGGFYKGL